MKKKTAYDIIKEIMTEVESTQTSYETMVEEVQMMRLKVRPLEGDIAILSNKNNNVIELLWRIGKIDQIVQKTIHTLPQQEQDQLIHYLENVEEETEQRLENILEHDETHTKTNRLLKVEIYKEYKDKTISN